MPPGGGPLRPGMFVRATAIFGVKDNALVVPEEAIVPQGGRQFVFKVVPRESMPGTATAALSPDVAQVSQRTEVRIGVRRPGRVEIEASGAVPLVEGDTVVTAGQQRLQRDGTGLRIVEIGRPGGGGGVGGPSPAASAPVSAAASGAVSHASAAISGGK
jgi:membrane fusion protein, multidrug efflux system